MAGALGYLLGAIRLLQSSPAWLRRYFVWVGGGSLSDQLKEAVNTLGIGEHVRIVGQRWDVADCLDAADAFVLTSEAEGMPLSIMEAMARGLPVAASAVSGIPEQLGTTGVLLPSPRVDPQAAIQALAATLTAWAQDGELRRTVGAACRHRALRLFREERMVEETLQVIDRALLPAEDYVAPGLRVVRLDPCFPHMVRGDPRTNPWPYLRRQVPHPWYVDRRAPQIGFLSRDEAHILYNSALRFAGRRALEIGCFLGWSTCHLARAGVALDVVDPLLAQLGIWDSVEASLQAAGVRDHDEQHPGVSPDLVEDLATRHGQRWSLFFIDGEHEGAGPLRDAQVAERFAEEDALILFHDLAAPPVARGFEYLASRGWQVLLYQTMQIMGAAWRGDVQPLAHRPDPLVAWELPGHLRHFPVAHET